MPSTAAVTKGIATAAGEEKVTAPTEMSEMHEADHLRIHQVRSQLPGWVEPDCIRSRNCDFRADLIR
jgi:hypothetical protein